MYFTTLKALLRSLLTGEYVASTAQCRDLKGGLGRLRSASDKSSLICEPTSASLPSIHQFEIYLGVSNLSYKTMNTKHYQSCDHTKLEDVTFS